MTQSRMTNAFVLLAAVAGLASARTAVGDAHPPRYTVTFLDAFQNQNTNASAINQLGQTTGESGTSSLAQGGYHAFLGQPDGTIAEIETLDCDTSIGKEVNINAQVAGHCTVFPPGGGSGTSFPFRYTPGQGMVDLSVVEGDHHGVIDMNDAGEVVGYHYQQGVYPRVYHAFLYRDETGLIDLGSLSSDSTVPRDINNAGQVVGWSEVNEFQARAFLWEDGVMQELGTLGGDTSSAYYINTGGVVVGGSRDASGTQRAFRYTAAGGMEQLPSPPGAVSCSAIWITDDGLIVGWWNDAESRQRGFCYTDAGGTVDIGIDLGSTFWTGPVAVNTAGQIILWVMDEINYDVFAYIYSSEFGLHDLNDLLAVDLGPDLIFDTPTDINDAGQVLLQGVQASRYVSAVLTPVQPGDLNCDGQLNGLDVGPFVTALVDAGAYAAEYPLCGVHFADLNSDEAVDLLDVEPFVNLLTAE